MTYKFKTSKIKMKNGVSVDYVKVIERIKFFNKEEPFKDWAIVTEVVSNVNNTVIIRAELRNKDNRIIRTAHASKNISTEFNMEKLETRAVGRVLGFMGIGSETSIATYDEVLDYVAYEKRMEKEAKEEIAAKKVFSKEETKGDTDILVDNITKTIRSKKTVEEMKEYAKELSSKREILSKEQATHINSVYMQKLKEIKGA